jgi:hypothetical protein
VTFDERITAEIKAANEEYLEQVYAAKDGPLMTPEQCLATRLVARICELENRVVELEHLAAESEVAS